VAGQRRTPLPLRTLHGPDREEDDRGGGQARTHDGMIKQPLTRTVSRNSTTQRDVTRPSASSAAVGPLSRTDEGPTAKGRWAGIGGEDAGLQLTMRARRPPGWVKVAKTAVPAEGDCHPRRERPQRRRHAGRTHHPTRLEEIRPSIASVGDAYDIALMESINGLYTHHGLPRRALQDHRRRRIRQPPAGSTDTTPGACTRPWGTPRPSSSSKPTTLP
jgi:hypothetical protein